MRILILAPLQTSKKLIPLLKPFTKTKEFNVESTELYGTLLKKYFKNTMSDTAAALLFAQSYNLINELLNHEKNADFNHTVIIGPLGNEIPVDKIIILYPDIVELEEKLFEDKVDFKEKYYLSVDADYTANSDTELLQVLKLCLKNKKQEKILH